MKPKTARFFNFICGSVVVCCLAAGSIIVYADLVQEKQTKALKDEAVEQVKERQLDIWKSRAFYWFGQYKTLEECIDRAAVNQTPARECLGDKTS